MTAATVLTPVASAKTPARASAGHAGSTGHGPGILAVALTATVTVMPGFTVGALAPSIEVDLHVSRSSLGLASTVLVAAGAPRPPRRRQGMTGV
ncbi:hypothetical protein ACWDZ4_25515 [Streptomyces sp. NPDC003016]